MIQEEHTTSESKIWEQIIFHFVLYVAGPEVGLQTVITDSGDPYFRCPSLEHS